MKNEQINIIFKQTFQAFIAEFFHCVRFENSVSDCKTYNDLNDTLKSYSGEINDALDFFNECDECSRRDSEIRDLEREIKELKENDEFRTLPAEAKFDLFSQNHEKFSVKQFEKLMN